MMQSEPPRESIAGPDHGPESPFPIKLRGPVIRGFGRGSRELGIPTANIPPTDLDDYPDLVSGVYYGFVGLMVTDDSAINTYPAVLSIGYNPFYNNTTRSIEIHILHHFHSDFYGASLNLLLLGFIRKEKNYDGIELLIQDIMTDCEVARKSLQRSAYASLEDDVWLRRFEWRERTNVEELENQVLARV